MRAVVVGAGIGGLATAIALRRVDVDCVVLERAPKLEAVGAGLGLAPNALQALERLGVADAVRAAAARAERVQLRSWRGGVLGEVHVRAEGWEFVGVHRADLQAALLDAVGAGVVRLGAECVGFETDGTRVAAVLADGSREEGDLLVGADGIRSVVRTQLVGENGPRYAGSVGWRAVIPFDHAVLGGIVSETWGCGVRFGLVPVGGGRLYWFIDEVAPRREGPLRGDPAAWTDRLRGWHDPIRDVVRSTPEGVLEGIPIEHRRPLRRWVAGRVALLGDAAHAMTPDISQGAAQALEDAVVLAASLSERGEPEAGLRLYEQRRRRRANALVRQAWGFGRLARTRTPVTCRLRDWSMRATPNGVQRAQQARIVSVELPELRRSG